MQEAIQQERLGQGTRMFWCGSPAALTNQFNHYSTDSFL